MSENHPAVEVAESEDLEPIVETTALVAEDPMSSDGMEAVIAVAQKMEAYEKAMNTIVNAIIRRAYPGDWVCHARADTKPEDRKANIGSAAAERIASFLGIGEKNWTPGLKSKSDDGNFFTWSFEADFGFGKRWIHAIGRASSKDKFFGYANGQWKAIEDVKEDDVRMAAFRACRKEGVRALLGLRSIPIEKLKELGYATDKIRFVGFEDKGKTLNDTSKEVKADTGMAEMIITVAGIDAAEGTSKSNGKPWRRLDIKDTESHKFIMWSGKGSKREAILRDSFESKADVKIHFQTAKSEKGEQYTIIKVNGEVDA